MTLEYSNRHTTGRGLISQWEEGCMSAPRGLTTHRASRVLQCSVMYGAYIPIAGYEYQFCFHRISTFGQFHLRVADTSSKYGRIKRTSMASVQFSSVSQSCLTLCHPMNRSRPGLPVHHQLPEFAQTHVHRVGDATQPSHPLSSPSPPAPNPSQHQGLFQWVNSSHEVAKVLEFQFQHQSSQWTTRTDLL